MRTLLTTIQPKPVELAGPAQPISQNILIETSLTRPKATESFLSQLITPTQKEVPQLQTIVKETPKESNVVAPSLDQPIKSGVGNSLGIPEFPLNDDSMSLKSGLKKVAAGVLNVGSLFLPPGVANGAVTLASKLTASNPKADQAGILSTNSNPTSGLAKAINNSNPAVGLTRSNELGVDLKNILAGQKMGTVKWSNTAYGKQTTSDPSQQMATKVEASGFGFPKLSPVMWIAIAVFGYAVCKKMRWC